MTDDKEIFPESKRNKRIRAFGVFSSGGDFIVAHPRYEDAMNDVIKNGERVFHILVKPLKKRRLPE